MLKTALNTIQSPIHEYSTFCSAFSALILPFCFMFSVNWNNNNGRAGGLNSGFGGELGGGLDNTLGGNLELGNLGM